jgi:hypothetical protein
MIILKVISALVACFCIVVVMLNIIIVAITHPVFLLLTVVGAGAFYFSTS